MPRHSTTPLVGPAPSSAARIQALLTARLRGGWRRPGEQLPTVRELASELQVGVLVVHRALHQLAELGFITTHGRLGTRVAAQPPYLHAIGLVVPVDLATTQPELELRWRAMVAAAAAFQEGPQQIELFLGLNGHPETKAHQHLLAACACGRLAGLILPDPQPIAGWFDPQRAGLPIVGSGSFRQVGQTALGDIHPAQLTFIEEALRQIAAQGRRRVAVLLHTHGGYALPHIWESAARHGIQIEPRHVQGIAPAQAHWAAHAVAAIFHGDQQPDALIIADDQLVPAATATLAHLQRPILTIAQANFPLESPSAVPCIRLGWDQRTFLSLACARIADHLATGAAIGDHHLPLITSGVTP